MRGFKLTIKILVLITAVHLMSVDKVNAASLGESINCQGMSGMDIVTLDYGRKAISHKKGHTSIILSGAQVNQSYIGQSSLLINPSSCTLRLITKDGITFDSKTDISLFKLDDYFNAKIFINDNQHGKKFVTLSCSVMLKKPIDNILDLCSKHILIDDFLPLSDDHSLLIMPLGKLDQQMSKDFDQNSIESNKNKINSILKD